MTAHHRKLTIGGVCLVEERLIRTRPAIDAVRDEMEKILIDTNFFEKAPFGRIAIVIRYGLANKSEPVYHRTSEPREDLPISIEVNAHALMDTDAEGARAIFRRIVGECLAHVGAKYNLPTGGLQ